MEDVEGGEMPFAGRIIMVAMNREYRDRDVNVRIFVVDVVERAVDSTLTSRHLEVEIATHNSPSKLLARITQHLDLAGLIAEAIHPQASHDLIHRFPRRLILMKEIASE